MPLMPGANWDGPLTGRELQAARADARIRIEDVKMRRLGMTPELRLAAERLLGPHGQSGPRRAVLASRQAQIIRAIIALGGDGYHANPMTGRIGTYIPNIIRATRLPASTVHTALRRLEVPLEFVAVEQRPQDPTGSLCYVITPRGLEAHRIWYLATLPERRKRREQGYSDIVNLDLPRDWRMPERTRDGHGYAE